MERARKLYVRALTRHAALLWQLLLAALLWQLLLAALYTHKPFMHAPSYTH